jgi:hypothetical protein
MVPIRPGAQTAAPNIKLRPPLLLARPETTLANRMGLELPRRCKIGVGRTAAPNVPDRQRSGCKSDGEAVAGEGRDMVESVADAIDSGSSLFARDNSPSEIAALPPRRVRHRARESTGRFVIRAAGALRPISFATALWEQKPA